MSYFYQGPASVVLTWSGGHGSMRGRKGERGYVLSAEARERLDTLLGAALVDADVRRRLLDDHDESLLADFAIPEETRVWLRGLNAASLTELAQAVAYHS